MRLFLALLFIPAIAYAAINGTSVTVTGTTTCNDGTVERTVAGTMTTTCGSGWSVGALPAAPAASTGTIAFTDLISGPATGLGDGNGSGAIVTVWGQNLGSTQGSSTIEFCDSASTCRSGYVYYWKNADGTLPSGPANLYESHGMQEIAFSIPAGSATGAGNIKVTVGSEESTAPFTVRAGNIYHVKSTGSDSNDGSFANPWLTVDKAQSSTTAGDTLYIHDVVTGSPTTDKAIYNNYAATDSTLAAQYAYIAYPNTSPEAIGHRGFTNYNGDEGIDGIVVSKYSVFAAEADTDANDLPINSRASVTSGITGSKNGRAVANYITDEHPTDTDGACPDGEQAAIVGNALGRNQIENWKVFGNMVEDYGCAGTTKQHHTTYFSNRSGTNNPPYQYLDLVSPEVAYNYLKNNHASGGLNYFDENQSGDNCGNFTTDFKFQNNVVLNQAGQGINNYSKCSSTTTTFKYYNNIVINAGVYDPNNALISSTKQLNNFASVTVNQSSGTEANTSTLDFYNNTFINWDVDDQKGADGACIELGGAEGTVTINWDDNVCLTNLDKPFIDSNSNGTALLDRISGDGSAWHTSAGTQVNAVAPTWDAGKITTDPLLTVTGPAVSVGASSPLIDQSSTVLDSDVYGVERGVTSEVGAVNR